jgi:hypothetical protein
MIPVQILVDRKVICETLCRMGIANLQKRILYPSVYLIHKDNTDFLSHFKELFILTKKENSYLGLTFEDQKRRNSIAFCLRQWNLINVSDELIDPHNTKIFVLKHEERKNWEILHKINRTLLMNIT